MAKGRWGVGDDCRVTLICNSFVHLLVPSIIYRFLGRKELHLHQLGYGL